MKIKLSLVRIILSTTLVSTQLFASAQVFKTDVLIIGGGASGTMAGIQSARMGTSTLIVEETEWLGGMLTSAGVTAIDGNHNMPSGLWGEFRQKLYNYYGGPQAVETGWVSNTLFEPSVANKMFKEMVAKEAKLSVWYKNIVQSTSYQNNKWTVKVTEGKKVKTIEAKIVIDATELGDVMAKSGAKYSIGMDSRYDTGEELAPEKANDIIQDITYVVTLKDYGKGADKTIKKPAGYDKAAFAICCDISEPSSFEDPNNNCFKMLQYGHLPNNKFMINWPRDGNDIYLNIIEKTREEREEALKEAKLHTLRFLYYIETELGYKNLGIADDEYPTADKLPMIPYHRESRRVKGLAFLTVNHVADPYNQKDAYYRTGIAVGDYPIDHHHLKRPDAPAIDFIRIKVPAYNIPLGSLIPQGVDGLIVAEKSISVSNIVNGASRLQPVVLGIGQAAGALAATASNQNVQPKDIDIRKVQEALLASNAYLMPFFDVKPTDPHFAIIQKIGATGILKGAGVPYKWANQTWFYPENSVTQYELVSGLRPIYSQYKNYWQASGESLTPETLVAILQVVNPAISIEKIKADWSSLSLKEQFSNSLILNRRTISVLLDHYLNPFEIPVDFNGTIKN